MAAVACPPSHANCGLGHGRTSSDIAEPIDIHSEFFAPTHPIDVSQEPPTDAELDSVADIPLLSETGDVVPFHSLWRSEDATRRHLIIFVRHFFCGNCQEYLRTLSNAIKAKDLLGLPRPTSIAVIGCGQPDLIRFYREATGCQFPIYAEPTRELYVRLGMARTMAPGDKKPDYVRKSMLGIVASGLTQGLTAGRSALKGGDFWQVGGEFLVENGQVTRCHRMTTTRDHAEVPQLREWLGFEHEDEEEDDERSGKKHKRNLISEVGASVRRSISMQRSGPNSSRSSRKASESSLSSTKEE